MNRAVPWTTRDIVSQEAPDFLRAQVAAEQKRKIKEEQRKAEEAKRKAKQEELKAQEWLRKYKEEERRIMQLKRDVARKEDFERGMGWWAKIEGRRIKVHSAAVIADASWHKIVVKEPLSVRNIGKRTTQAIRSGLDGLKTKLTLPSRRTPFPVTPLVHCKRGEWHPFWIPTCHANTHFDSCYLVDRAADEYVRQQLEWYQGQENRRREQERIRRVCAAWEAAHEGDQ